MTEDSNKVVHIDWDAKAAELTEESLDNIAGGGEPAVGPVVGPVVAPPVELSKTKINGSRSNIKSNLA